MKGIKNMTNNLQKVKQDLCSFAKRAKDFKYTDSALIAFLLTGIIGLSVAFNAYSAQDEIEIQRKAIDRIKFYLDRKTCYNFCW